MKFGDHSKDFKQAIIEMLDKSNDKSEAIYQAIEKVCAEKNEEFIEMLEAEQSAAGSDRSYFAKRGYKTHFSADESKFYEAVVKQAITADQVDVIPTSIIDRTLNDIKQDSNILSLINFAPADVKKWLTGSATGSAVWGNLTSAINAANDISATIDGIDFELHKLYAVMIIPKAIRELSMPLVDKYFTAKLGEVMKDGIATGYMNGNGTAAPIGIFYNLPSNNGTISAKQVDATMTSFSLDQMAPAKIMLSNGGRRTINELYLVCNPLDRYTYIDPAIKFFNGSEYVQVTDIPIEIIADSNCPQGKAALTMKGLYTMGFSGLRVDEYKETKAMDDADLIIGKTYGNGRPDDDSTAYVFDPSKLHKFVPEIKDISNANE